MKLNSDQLNAFYEVAQKRSFTKAADALGLSQPALSLRVKRLELELKTSLFIRETAGIALTSAGEKLLLHCQLREQIEHDILDEMSSTNQRGSAAVSGIIRIVGFSTVVRSVLLPSLHGLIEKHPNVRLETSVREMNELAAILKRSEADFAVSEGPIVLGNVENILIGYEENVTVESRKPLPGREDIYLDNDSADQATFNFFKAQPKGKNRPFKRDYLDEVYTILDAVELGWGRSVQPKHLLKGRSKLRVVPDFKSVKVPIYLNYFKQPYYTKIHELVRTHIQLGFKNLLGNS